MSGRGSYAVQYYPPSRTSFACFLILSSCTPLLLHRLLLWHSLASLAGIGQSSANTLTSAAGTLGSQIGSNIIGAGNARAAGTVGIANAISSGVGQGINYYQGQQYLNRLPNYAGTNSAPVVDYSTPYSGQYEG